MAQSKDGADAAFRRFVAANREDVLYVGIDPGMQGAIGLIGKKGVHCLDLPTYKKKTASNASVSMYDLGAIADWFALLKDAVLPRDVRVCLEEGQNMPKDTAKTARSIGYSTGMWPLFLQSHGFPLTMVSPSAWKKKAKLLGQDKEYARNLAISRWPSAELGRKKDHNRAEALFLAEHLRLADGNPQDPAVAGTTAEEDPQCARSVGKRKKNPQM